MGIYYVNCAQCKNTFPWFSGDAIQLCESCRQMTNDSGKKQEALDKAAETLINMSKEEFEQAMKDAKTSGIYQILMDGKPLCNCCFCKSQRTY